jgi:hypothetical protein
LGDITSPMDYAIAISVFQTFGLILKHYGVVQSLCLDVTVLWLYNSL